METLMYIGYAVIATMAVMSAVFVIIQSRKDGEAGIPWDKIRPILTESITEATTLIKAKEKGYQAIEDFAVSFIKKKIDGATFLRKEEKKLLSEDLIRSVVSPRLKELYDKHQGR